MKRKSKLFRLSYKITIMVICLIIVSTSVIGILAYYSYRERSIEIISNNLGYVAQYAATLVDPVQYREIMASGEKNDYHDRLDKAYAEIAAVYELFAIHAGEIDPVTGFKGFIGPIELGCDLWQELPPTAFPPEAFAAMATGKVNKLVIPAVTEQYRQDLNVSFTLVAYAPVFDENGNTIAIVSASSVDDGIYADSRAFAMRMVGIVLATIIVLIWIPIIFTRLSIGKPITSLSAATNAIVKGDLSGEINIKSNDELGVLSGNFSAMQASLREKMESERTARQAELERGRAEAAANAMRDSIIYASKIQRTLLPPDSAMAAALTDFSVIWKPRDIVGGDIYWMKKFDKGTVLCVADCTGHGTPGAFLTMLVVSALDGIVAPGNCDDTAEIIWRLDQRLSAVLHAESAAEGRHGILNIDDGCDIAVLFIAKDGSVKFSSGRIPVFVCDGNRVTQYTGQRIFVGEGRLKNKHEVFTHSIPAYSGNKFYIASDGLFNQIGGEQGIQFGQKTFTRTILENHHEKQSVITGKIWDAFETYRGDETQRDDFELIAFKP